MSPTHRKAWLRSALVALLGGAAALAAAQDMPMHHPMAGPGTASAKPDTRILVKFPPRLRRAVLATMRMHLQGVSEVQQAMTAGRYGDAARIASMTLGMSAMADGQMQQEARYMPAGMRQMGSTLHMQAGEFVLAAQDAEATGDTRKPQVLFGRMLQTCVACHASYRLR